MAKPKFDFKQFLLQHGERLGLGVAGAITGFLLLMCILAFFSSGSPAEKADALKQPTEWVDLKLKDPNNVPGDKDKPENAQERLFAYSAAAVNAGDYYLAAFIPPGNEGALGR